MMNGTSTRAEENAGLEDSMRTLTAIYHGQQNGRVERRLRDPSLADRIFLMDSGLIARDHPTPAIQRRGSAKREMVLAIALSLVVGAIIGGTLTYGWMKRAHRSEEAARQYQRQVDTLAD